MRLSKRKRLAAQDAMDVAARFVNAANQHDVEGLIACVHRDFQSIQPAHPARNFRGVLQLRSNWEAIFRTEPGFRLTVLRSTVTDGTVWLELHGAGDDAEAAGTFILGVEDGRIRWIRVYSDLVEPLPEPEPEPEPALAAVPTLQTQRASEAAAAHVDAERPQVLAEEWDAILVEGEPVEAPSGQGEGEGAEGEGAEGEGAEGEGAEGEGAEGEGAEGEGAEGEGAEGEGAEGEGEGDPSAASGEPSTTDSDDVTKPRRRLRLLRRKSKL